MFIFTGCYRNIQSANNTVSPAGLEVPPTRVLSDPPIPAPADCRLEDWMRTGVFSPTYPTWALVGGLQGQRAKLYEH